MKRKIAVIVILISALSLTTLFTPEIKAETEYERLQKTLKQYQENQNKVLADAKKTEKELKNVLTNIRDITNEINKLDLDLSETENKIKEMENQITETQAQAEEATMLLDAAIARVKERDELLKTRVRAMYETGEVSYLEVLLDSTSIGDFLTRIDMMEKVVDSDKNILAVNIADKEEIEARKIEVDAYLAQLNLDYEELSTLKVKLESQKKEMTIRVASLEKREEELEQLIEEQGQELLVIANKITQTKKEIDKQKYSGGQFAWPVPDSTRITSNYGTRTDPITKRQSTHNGTDIGAPQGTTIVAAADGTVILAEMYGTYGNTVMIDHSGVVTLYAHIRNGGIKVKVGEKVTRGQKIAEIGTTGRSTGPHLHFSVIENGKYIDPMKYLKGK